MNCKCCCCCCKSKSYHDYLTTPFEIQARIKKIIRKHRETLLKIEVIKEYYKEVYEDEQQ